MKLKEPINDTQKAQVSMAELTDIPAVKKQASAYEGVFWKGEGEKMEGEHESGQHIQR